MLALAAPISLRFVFVIHAGVGYYGSFHATGGKTAIGVYLRYNHPDVLSNRNAKPPMLLSGGSFCFCESTKAKGSLVSSIGLSAERLNHLQASTYLFRRGLYAASPKQQGLSFL